MPESTAPITSENTAQKIPEGTAQTRASAEAAGSPDSTNDKNDTNVSNVKKRGKLIGILAAAAVLIAAVIGISIYNAPANRMSRALDLGTRYLEEQNYEQALVEFDKVIAIDPMSVEAYLGKAQAYEGMGDMEQQLAVLQTGYEQTGDSQIKKRLVDVYLEQASGSATAGDYESALAVYDKLLDLDGENEEVQRDLSNLLNSYFRKLIDERNYDEARALIEKYIDKVSGVDFQAYLNEIEEKERIEAENKEFLQKVFDLMAAQDYEAMHEVDGSEEANAFVERMEQDFLVYVPENDAAQTGKGAGVYQFGEGGYYFYYGDFADGSREGEGCSFCCNHTEEVDEIFTGLWKNDAPNGEGTLEQKGGTFTDTGEGFQGKISSGNLIDGLWDGPVDVKLSWDGYTYDLSFTAVHGAPQEDVTEEYEDLGYQTDFLEEGAKFYAFDVSPSGQVVGSWIGADGLVGTIGYGSVK